MPTGIAAPKSDLPGIQNMAGRCKPPSRGEEGSGKINNADTPDLHLSGFVAIRVGIDPALANYTIFSKQDTHL
jgi:hypothetical protein